MKVKEFIDDATSTISYIVSNNGKAVILDPVLNYNAKAGTLAYVQAEEMLNYINKENLDVLWILETHAHADHLSSAQYLKEKTGAKIAVGKGILEVQKIFNTVFNMKAQEKDFDLLLDEKDVLDCGGFKIEAIATPGHTPACMTYKIGDNLFVGDTVFMHDVGSARCDFPGGNAETLYDSVQKILSFKENTNIYLCHDYPPVQSNRKFTFKTSVGEIKEKNIHLNKNISKEKFIRLRTERDKVLDNPALLFQSIQVNVKAGKLPEKEQNGIVYLKFPLKIWKILINKYFCDNIWSLP